MIKFLALCGCLMALSPIAGAATPQIYVSSPKINEGTGGSRYAAFNVMLSQTSTVPVEVVVVTKDGSARAGEDYLATNQTISFAPGVRQRSFGVRVMPDSKPESDEHFFVTASARGYSASNPAATCTLLNDDVAPIPLYVSSPKINEGTGGARHAVFVITLGQTSTVPVQVTLATQNGTARAGEDYLATNQTITFAPGVRQSTLMVRIVPDSKFEGDEYFCVNASARGYSASCPTGTCTLLNDDISPTPTPRPSPTATPRPTATPLPVATSTPAPIVTPTPIPTTTPTPPNPVGSTRMVAYADTWADARERWWDIGSARIGSVDTFNVFDDWIAAGQPTGAFDYATRAANVVLTYARNPGVPYFVGHISARGLKPNFAYQLKLTGKPVNGPRGTGKAQSYVSVTDKTTSGAPQIHTVLDSGGNPTPINGDDWTNQQLGYVGRWWNDSNASGNTNAITDSVYAANTTDTIYGYQFLGDFVTDAKGNAEADINGRQSFHITWQDRQNGIKDVFFGTFPVSGFLDASNPSHYYGYGPYAPSTGDAANGKNGLSSVGLWYELQWDRPNPVVLAGGTYHCRMLITEETFHNMYGDTNSILGGKWKTVMATEDRDIASNAPDAEASNDIVFSIP